MSRRGDKIHKRKDGRWEGRYIYSRNNVGRAIYRSVYGKTYAEAKEKLTNAKKSFKESDYIYENLTVEEIAEKWFQEVKVCKKYSTYIKYKYIYDIHIRKYLEKKKISSVTAEECVRVIKRECIKENSNEISLSRSMVNSIRNVLTQIMKYGNNPIKISSDLYNITNLKCIYNNGVSIFTKDEQKRILEYLLLDMNNYKLGIYVCMFTGLRLGEICALKTTNIDLSKRIIYVTHTAQRIKSDSCEKKTELLMSKPKTPTSYRMIPICDILFNVLKEYMSNEIYLVNGFDIMEPRTYQYFFQRILNSLSIEKKNFHSLRHTFATNCISSGMDPKCLSEILGHADVKTTLNRYVHPSLEIKLKQLNSFATDYGHSNGHF